MSDVMGMIEQAVAEVPESVGTALKWLGDEVAKLGSDLQALAARMDHLEHPEGAA
jgi:hypothetical protein